MQAQLLSKIWNDVRRDPNVPNAVTTSWKVSFDQIKHESESAATLLALVSMFDRQGIPETLLFEDTVVDLEKREALALLFQYSFLTEEKKLEGTSYSMHRLLQICARAWLMENNELSFWEGEAVSQISKRFPSGEFETWTECKILVPHARKALEYSVSPEKADAKHRLLADLGWYEYEKGNYEISQSLFEGALAESERHLGPNHSKTLQLMEKLAIVYQHQARYDEAEILYQRTLVECEKQLGPEHLRTLQTVHNLAMVYECQRRHAEAGKLFRRALAGKLKQLGPKHLSTLRTVQNLAIVYQHQAGYNKAEALYQRALAEQESQLGPKHPSTLRTMQNMALFYDNQGRRDEAEAFFHRALVGRENQLGAEHPSTLQTARCLAKFYENRGRLEEAESLRKRLCLS